MENNSYDSEMTIKGKIWKVDEGKVIEVKIDNDIFVKKSLKQVSVERAHKIEPVKTVEPEQIQPLSYAPLAERLGEKIDVIASAGIFRKVLDDLLDAVRQGQNNDYLIDIIRKHHPNIKHESIATYLSAYKRYISKTYPDLSGLLLIYKHEYMQKPEDISTKGKSIDRMGHNTLYENILNEIKDSYKRGLPRSERDNILRKYYPNSVEQSIKTYISAYKRYLVEKGNIRRTLDGYEYVDGSISVPIDTKRGLYKKRRRKRKKRPGSIGFDKKYGAHIMEDELNEIKKAINNIELDYKPTSYNIKEKTGLTIHKIRATLHWMLEQKMITWFYKDNVGPIYKMTT